MPILHCEHALTQNNAVAEFKQSKRYCMTSLDTQDHNGHKLT